MKLNLKLNQIGFFSDHYFSINIYFCDQINSNTLVSIMKTNFNIPYLYRFIWLLTNRL
jgi:hypothetical protein